MIRGMPAMFNSSDAEGLRAFLRDKRGLKGIESFKVQLYQAKYAK